VRSSARPAHNVAISPDCLTAGGGLSATQIEPGIVTRCAPTAGEARSGGPNKGAARILCQAMTIFRAYWVFPGRKCYKCDVRNNLARIGPVVIVNAGELLQRLAGFLGFRPCFHQLDVAVDTHILLMDKVWHLAPCLTR